MFFLNNKMLEIDNDNNFEKLKNDGSLVPPLGTNSSLNFIVIVIL